VDTWDCNRPVTKLLMGDAPGIPVAETGIIDNGAAWCDLWDRIYVNASPPPSCDRTLVDFSSEVVLFAALGMRSSGGFTAEIACVHENEGDPQLRVQVLATSPGPHCIVTMALTYPISVVKVARPVQDAVFETTETVQDCP
jgi:hypothetical protein